ncbi:MAG: amidohydrolase family protein, partial [Chloroflexi bacterium]|nr:amidohydrolase family protein [Chloroflexota bacterium]
MSKLALRGSLFYVTDDPFLNPPEDCAVYESDGIIVIEDGKISAVGSAAEILPALADDVEVRRYARSILMPGFVDAHIHYPQVEIIGSYGTQLLEWLNKYTFPTEAKFNDDEHAKRIAQ